MKELYRLEIKSLVYLLFITVIAFANQYLFDDVPGISWLTLSILSSGLINSGNTLLHQLMITIITGIMAALVVFIVVQLPSLSILIASFLLIVTIICTLLYEIKQEYFYNIFLVNFFAILATGLLQIKYQNNNQYLYIFLGFFIVSLMQLIFSINFIKNNLCKILLDNLEALKALSEKIFSCLLSPDYNNNKYLFERRLHKQKNTCIQSLQQLIQASLFAEKKVLKDKKEILIFLNQTLNSLFDIFIDCALIRQRVTDYSLFEICKDELQALDIEIAHYINHINDKSRPYDISNLNFAINKLESIYNTVLQVAAPEPLAFLLFIESLKELSKKLTTLNQLMIEFYDYQTA